MNSEFNHAANDFAARVAPLLWGAIVVALIAIAIWFAMKP
jgi:hypothetical protein